MQSARPPLLEALFSLKPNTIYTMAPAKAIASAAGLFAQDPVKRFRWGASGKVLEAEIDTAEPLVVQFTCANGVLHGLCDCLRGGASNCRHVLAAAMTIARVLHETKFHRVDLPPDRVEKLRRQLRAPVPESARPKVVFASAAPGEPFTLDYDGGVRGVSWRSTGVPPGMEWLQWQERQPEKVAAAFGQWLESGPGEVGLEVRMPEGNLTFPKATWRWVRAETQFQWEGGAVAIRRAVLDENGQPVENFIALGYGLALLPEEAVFAGIEGGGGWSAFFRLQSEEAQRNRFTLEADDFNARCFPFGSGEDFTLFDGPSTPAQARETVCRAMVIAKSNGAETVQVRLRGGDGEGREWPVHANVCGLLQAMFRDGPFALLGKSPARRRRLAEFLARLATLEGEKEPLLLEASRDPAFTSYELHGEDAMNALRELGERLQQLDEKSLLANPGEPGCPWLACSGAGSALGRALAVFVDLFPGEELLRSKDFVFEVERSVFFAALPRLIGECERRQVTFRLDGKKARAETLTLSVRAIQSGEIDWFELHPEACAGMLAIPRERWEEILRTGQYQADAETFVTLDEASLAALRQMTGLLGTAAGEELRVPRLRLFDWLALRTGGVACELPPELESVLQSLLNLERIPPQPLPVGLRAEMREYQRHGYEWLAFLYRHRFGACLADDMGLGKTIQTIALLAAIREGTLARQSSGAPEPHLVVLPPTLLFNWQSEIQRFAPFLKIHEYTGQNRSADFSGADVVLTTYDLARRDIETLSAMPFDVIVFDEAQAVKNAAAARTQALGKLKGRFRVCLTGTPLENHIGEFHSIMEAAVPGLFGERKRFLREYEAGLPVLARAKPFLLRRTREKILAELPPKTEVDAYFALSDSQKECYTRAVGEVRREVLAAYEDKPAQQAGIVALTALLRLRQICVAPAMLGGELDESSPKLDYLVEQLAELAEEGHAALVFSQFVKALDLVGRALENAGLPFLRLDGSTPTSRRKELVEAFQSGEGPGIFLISLKTGGSGLNLPRASYIYHLDPWWNPAVEAQANARAHRIGQKKGVYVQRLLMRHTVEEKMMVLKERKAALFAAVVENGETTAPTGAASLTADDFRFLVEGF